MSIDPDFYKNLFKALSEQAKPRRPHPIGWGGSEELIGLMKKLHEEASARHVFIIERTGKESASYGDLGHIDISDLIALVVGKIFACSALAELVNGRPFETLSTEGKRWGIHFSMLDQNTILMVVFDHQTNIDRVGQRVKRAREALAAAIGAAKEERGNHKDTKTQSF
jgi:hypothetical protein